MQSSPVPTFLYTLEEALQRAGYRFCRSVRLGKPIVLAVLAGMFVFGIATLLLACALGIHDLIHKNPLGNFAGMFIAGLGTMAFVAQVCRSSRRQCQPFFDLGDISIALTPDGVVYSSRTRSGLLSWLDVRGFKRDGRLFMLFTDQHYLPMPIHAIPMPEDAAAFIQESLIRHVYAAFPVLPPRDIPLPTGLTAQKSFMEKQFPGRLTRVRLCPEMLANNPTVVLRCS